MTIAKWPRRRLGDICQTASGGTPDRSGKSYYGGTIPWVKSGELRDDSIIASSEAITEEALRQSSAKVFPAATLLIAMYGANVGQLGLLDIPAATNQAVCGIFPAANLDRSFLFFVLLLDTRTPAELLAAIEAKGKEVDAALAKLRALL